MQKMHYSGAICYDTARSTAHVLGGYAACCSGDRTIKLRNKGLVTRDKGAVTCKRCQSLMAKAVHCRSHPESCCVPPDPQPKLSPGQRWEQGIDHDPRSERLVRGMAKIDFERNGDELCIKVGGDGDNGETMMYLLDCYFAEGGT